MEKIIVQNMCASDKSMEILWQRKDLVLLASGSLTCLRGLYQRAVLQGALSQFRYLILRNEDYILGTAEEEIRRGVREAAFLPGVRMVVIYLSCLDLLIRLDFADLEESLSRETGCLVKCFFRGPLAKDDVLQHADAQTLLRELPAPESCIDMGALLPPPLSDVAGVSDFLRQKNTANILVTPSGCRNALVYGDLTASQNDVYAIKPPKEDFIFGMEKTVRHDIEFLMQSKDYEGINLLESSVPAFMGMNENMILQGLPDTLRLERYFPTDGFHDAVYGVAMAMLALLRSTATHWKEAATTVLVLGYSRLLSGAMEQFSPEIQYIHSLGYKIEFAGIDDLLTRPALIWIVSATGIPAAKWVGRCFGIPLLFSLPLGEHAFSTWKKNVEELITLGHGIKALKIHNMAVSALHKEKILIVGDPMATMAIGHALWHIGYHSQRQMSYAWSVETEDIYSQAPGAERVRFFQSKCELQETWDEADIVIADPCLISVMGDKRIIPFPSGLFSGRDAVGEGSGVLGEKFLNAMNILVGSGD